MSLQFVTTCLFYLDDFVKESIFLLLKFSIPRQQIAAVMKAFKNEIALTSEQILSTWYWSVCWHIWFIPFSLTTTSLLSRAGLLPSLPYFLLLGISQLLCSVEDFLRDLPALFHSLVHLRSLPGVSTDYLPKELEVCFPKVQEVNLAPLLDLYPLELQAPPVHGHCSPGCSVSSNHKN